MLHFNSTTDALLVLSWLSIDHRCSLTNCGKVICLRNRNYRHDLYSPSQQTHIISLSSSKRLCSDIQTSTILHNHKNPWARPSEGTPDGKGGGITQANPQNSCHPSGLIWKCHRPARIHKHPLQGYLHSYKKTMHLFLGST